MLTFFLFYFILDSLGTTEFSEVPVHIYKQKDVQQSSGFRHVPALKLLHRKIKRNKLAATCCSMITWNATCCGLITWKSAGVVRIRCVPLWVSTLYICCELFTVIYFLSLPAENGYSGFFKNVQFDIKGSGFLKLMITVCHISWGRGWKFWNWYTPGARVF